MYIHVGREVKQEALLRRLQVERENIQQRHLETNKQALRIDERPRSTVGVVEARRRKQRSEKRVRVSLTRWSI